MYQARTFGGRVFTHEISSFMTDDCEPRPPPRMITVPHPYDMVNPVPTVPDVTIIENSVASSLGFLSNCGEQQFFSTTTPNSITNNSSKNTPNSNSIQPRQNQNHYQQQQHHKIIKQNSLPKLKEHNEEQSNGGCCCSNNNNNNSGRSGQDFEILQGLIIKQNEVLFRMESQIKKLTDFQENYLAKIDLSSTSTSKPLTYDRDVQTVDMSPIDGPLQIYPSAKGNGGGEIIRRASLELQPTYKKNNFCGIGMKRIQSDNQKTVERDEEQLQVQVNKNKTPNNPSTFAPSSSSDKTVYGMSPNYLSFATKKYLQRYGLLDEKTYQRNGLMSSPSSSSVRLKDQDQENENDNNLSEEEEADHLANSKLSFHHSPGPNNEHQYFNQHQNIQQQQHQNLQQHQHQNLQQQQQQQKPSNNNNNRSPVLGVNTYNNKNNSNGEGEDSEDERILDITALRRQPKLL